jgi:hypothetical protein
VFYTDLVKPGSRTGGVSSRPRTQPRVRSTARAQSVFVYLGARNGTPKAAGNRSGVTEVPSATNAAVMHSTCATMAGGGDSSRRVTGPRRPELVTQSKVHAMAAPRMDP